MLCRLAPTRGHYFYQSWPVMSHRARGQQMEARPPVGSPAISSPAALSHPMSTRVDSRDTGTEQLCDGRGTAPSDPGSHPRNRDLLPVFSCREINSRPSNTPDSPHLFSALRQPREQTLTSQLGALGLTNSGTLRMYIIPSLYQGSPWMKVNYCFRVLGS